MLASLISALGRPTLRPHRERRHAARSVINAVWRFIYTRAYITCLTIYIHARAYIICTKRCAIGGSRSVDIGTCYRGDTGGFDPPFVVVLLLTDATPPGRKAAGWWGLTVTDDRCPESNTYIPLDWPTVHSALEAPP